MTVSGIPTSRPPSPEYDREYDRVFGGAPTERAYCPACDRLLSWCECAKAFFAEAAEQLDAAISDYVRRINVACVLDGLSAEQDPPTVQGPGERVAADE